MTAQPQEKPNPKERADLFIATYQAEYSEAIHEARIAAKTTATEAWQNNYRHNMKTHREIIDSHLASIRNTCEAIKSGDTAEDFEKDIRDSVKALAEERIRFGAWRLRTIDPYTRTVDTCKSIIGRTIRDAEETQRTQPLLDRGLADEIRARVDTWPSAAWDDENGAIEVADPDTGEVVGAS